MKIIIRQTKENNNKPNKNREYIKWITRISTLAFFLSLFLSLFSEMMLVKSRIFVAVVLLFIFTFLNVISDMIGLAITACQIEELKKEKIEKHLFEKCMFLIKNSDKVSSLLCDVVGDISGILCGASGTMIAMIISSFFNFQGFNILIVALVSSFIAGITVLFKAIAKRYAIENSLKIVKNTAKITIYNTKFFKIFKNNKR